MKTLHTKGNWERKPHIGITNQSKPLNPVYYNNVCTTKGIGGQIIAKCLSKNREELMANAKLIAAAPDLLEALKYVLKEKMNQHGETPELRSDIREKIEAAIKKATQ